MIRGTGTGATVVEELVPPLEVGAGMGLTTPKKTKALVVLVPAPTLPPEQALQAKEATGLLRGLIGQAPGDLPVTGLGKVAGLEAVEEGCTVHPQHHPWLRCSLELQGCPWIGCPDKAPPDGHEGRMASAVAKELGVTESRITGLTATGTSTTSAFVFFDVVNPIPAPTSNGGTSSSTTVAPVPVPRIIPQIPQTEEDTKPWIIAVAVAVGVGIVGVFSVVFYCTREEKEEVTAPGASAMAEKPVDVEKAEAQQMQEEAAGRKKAEGGDVEAQTSPCGDGEMTEPCKGEDGGVGRLRIRVDGLTSPGAMPTLPYGNELPSGTPGMSTEPHSRTSNEPYFPDRSDD